MNLAVSCWELITQDIGNWSGSWPLQAPHNYAYSAMKLSCKHCESHT